MGPNFWFNLKAFKNILYISDDPVPLTKSLNTGTNRELGIVRYGTCQGWPSIEADEDYFFCDDSGVSCKFKRLY